MWGGEEGLSDRPRPCPALEKPKLEQREMEGVRRSHRLRTSAARSSVLIAETASPGDTVMS